MKKEKSENKIHSFWGNLSISKKFSTVMILTVLFLGILPIAVSYIYSSIILRNSFDRNIENILNQTLLNIEFRTNKVEEVLYDITTDKSLQTKLSDSGMKLHTNEYSTWELANSIRSILIAESLKNEYIAAISIYDNIGNCFSVGNTFYEPKGLFDVVDFEKVEVGKGASIWFNPMIFESKSTNIGNSFTVVPVAKLMYDSKTIEKVGYLLVFVKASYFYECIEDISFYPDDIFIITDQNGKIIAGKNNNDDVLVAAEYNTIYSIKYHDRNCYLATWAKQDSVLKLTCITRNAYRSPHFIRLRILTVSMLCLITLIAFNLIHIIAVSVSNPIMALTKEMKQFSHGDFSLQISAKYDDEVGILRRTFNQQVNDIRRLVDTVYKEKELRQQAQLKMLQMQINPHFLYNSLDTINWLALDHGDEAVSEVSMSIGYLMRFSLSDRDLVPFEEELDAVEHYFLIQKYRFGNQLFVDYEISEDALYEMIPPHIMLPIIENSFNHGFKGKDGDKKVKIKAEIINDDFQIHIEDNGIGMDKGRLEELLDSINLENAQIESINKSIGLRNVNQRLILKYGKGYGLKIKSNESTGTSISICIPCNSVNESIDDDERLC